MQIKRRKPKRRPEIEQKKRTRLNGLIRVPEVRLVDENNASIGVIKTEDALKKAKDAELDLVEVNPKAQPPVCKIMDFGKYKYEQDKLAHKQKVASKKSEIKGIRLSFKIKGNDLETRVNQTKKFLQGGSQIKIEMILKGREKALANNARNIIQGFIKEFGEDVKIMQPVQKQGGRFSAIIAPVNK